MGYLLVELDSLCEDTAEDYMDGDRLHDSLSILGAVTLLRSSPTSVGDELMSELYTFLPLGPFISLMICPVPPSSASVFCISP